MCVRLQLARRLAAPLLIGLMAGSWSAVLTADELPPVVTPEEFRRLESSRRGQSNAPPAENIPQAPPKAAAPAAAPLRPAPPRAAEPRVHAAKFLGLVPGKATRESVLAALGEPEQSTQTGGGQIVLSYGERDLFSSIEVVMSGDAVKSLVAHFQRPQPVAVLASELGIDAFRPVGIRDDNGALLGHAYPERGIVLISDAEAAFAAATHIVLEPVAAEPFLLRAEESSRESFTACLADLAEAERLDPHDGRIFALRSRILAALGKTTAALECAKLAPAGGPHDAECRLLAARAHFELGDFDHAQATAEELAGRGDLSPRILAEVQILLGDLVAQRKGRNFNQALEHHLAAIQLAAGPARDGSEADRRWAQPLLVAAHLSAAEDIAKGRWQKKTETAMEWLQRADAIAEDAVQNHGGDEALRFAVHARTLAVLAGLEGEIDPRIPADAAIDDVRRLSSSRSDPLYVSHLRWRLGEAIFDAALIEQARGNNLQALKHATHSLSLLEQEAPAREATARQDYLLGRVLFRIGSIHAVGQNDHQAAIEWYEKAADKLRHPLPQFARGEADLHGERFVSMGASYWKVGMQDVGLALTERGIGLLEEAVEDAAADRGILALPYSNFAAMHNKLGNRQEAQRLAQLSAEAERSAVRQR